MYFLNFMIGLVALVPLSAAHGYKRCWDPQPSEQFRLKSVERYTDAKNNGTLNIKTFVHVVTTKTKEGKYSASQIKQQIDALNKGYKQNGVSFTLASTDFTVNNAWAKASPFASPEFKMKYALHKGTYSDLNLYFLSDLDNNSGLLGNCPMPEDGINGKNPSELDKIYINHDGCILLADTLPGGDAVPFNLGATAVHETGHWFGGFHVFNSGTCSKKNGGGDGVPDTPPQKTATKGCPKFKNSCPGGGPDSIHNFMDYSDDICLYDFTPDQASQWRSNYNQFRACDGACS